MGFFKQAYRKLHRDFERLADNKRIWVYLLFISIGALIVFLLDNSPNHRAKFNPLHIPLNNFLYRCQQANLTAIIIHIRR